MSDKQELISVLKSICNKKIMDNIKLININDNKELILKGIMFDDDHMCYHNYNTLDDLITGLMISADNYGIFVENNFIGIISIFNQYYKDLTRSEISISIKKEYRNKGIGKYCYNYIIDNYFKNDKCKSIHLSIREDNIKSRMLAENCGFKLYKGYKCDNYFTDFKGNKIPQVQYLLKKNDYIKKHILLIYEYMFDIIHMETFEIYQMFSLSLKRKVVVNYDKKRIISIYYNSTIIFCSNHLTI